MEKTYKKLIFLMAFVLLLTVSCSKDDSNDESENQIAAYALVSDVALPGEAVQIKSSKAVVESEIEVMLNNTPIKAYANGDSYVFIMPVLAPGNYTLKFHAADNDITLPLKVDNYVAITNPEEIINDFVVDRDKCFDLIKEKGSSPETLLLIDQIKEEWDLQYSKNSTEDKMLLAYMLKKNTVNPEWFSAPSEYPDSYYNRS